MPFFKTIAQRHNLIAASALVALMAALLWSYAPIRTGSIHFDDGTSLNGLASVGTAPEALEFVTSGIAGPTGRPLALASFLPHAALWPNVPQVFLRENLLIHVINALLLACLTLRMSQARGSSDSVAAWSAVIAAALWGAVPLLASTSYLIVQRMTSLSACFSLIGLLGFVYGHQLWARAPRWGAAVVALSLGLGTLLATFCKESGALTPVLALSLTTLLKMPPSLGRRWLGIVMMWAPLMLICAYMLYLTSHSPSGVRDFDTLQRVTTEATIMWQYLWRAVVPNGFALGPFHDYREALTPWYSAAGVVALAAWAGILAAAIRLRNSAPLFAFAVFWFLGGHLLESTVIILELYFEHRNYVPLMGPCIALGLSITKLSPAKGRLLWPLVAIYFVLQLAVLNNVTRMVGNPPVAATLWHDRFPASVRAAQFAIGFKLEQGEPRAAQDILDSTFRYQPTDISLWLQRIQLRCINGRDDEIAMLMEHSRDILQTGRYNYSVFSILNDLAGAAAGKTCPSVTQDTLLRVTAGLLSNPRFRAPWVMALLHHIRSQHHSFPQDMALELEKAWALSPLIETALSLVVVMRNSDRDCDARKFLLRTISEPPAGWSEGTLKENIAKLQGYLDSLPSDACSH